MPHCPFSRSRYGPPVARAAAVVHVHDRKAAAGPVLHLEVEPAVCGCGRTAVADDDQRRAFASRRGEPGVTRRIVEGVCGEAVPGRKLNRLRDRDESLGNRRRRDFANPSRPRRWRDRPGRWRQARAANRTPGRRACGSPPDCLRARGPSGSCANAPVAQSIVARRHRPFWPYATTSREAPANAQVRVPSCHGGRPNSADIGCTASMPPWTTRYRFHQPVRSETKYSMPSGDHSGWTIDSVAAAGHQCRSDQPAVGRDFRRPRARCRPTASADGATPATTAASRRD